MREKGFSIDQAEEIEGMHCVGAPIFNRQGYPIAAIWITGPSFRLETSKLDVIGPKVKKCADNISKNLGYITNQKEVGEEVQSSSKLTLN